MSSNMTARRIDEIKGMNEFPLPKGPALALIRLTQREFVSLAVVAHAIKADPTFAVRAIRVANGVAGWKICPVRVRRNRRTDPIRAVGDVRIEVDAKRALDVHRRRPKHTIEGEVNLDGVWSRIDAGRFHRAGHPAGRYRSRPRACA